ncbi:MAG: hypothetical protein Ct9H300mP8_06480 [Gammaproteobacteria bacterium]|nr:MAG: hypothetical protein Ct9H300mP8_06480 [Gammaproteobacteria bacterium]
MDHHEKTFAKRLSLRKRWKFLFAHIFPKRLFGGREEHPLLLFLQGRGKEGPISSDWRRPDYQSILKRPRHTVCDGLPAVPRKRLVGSDRFESSV